MINNLLLSQAAGHQCAWPLAASAQGTRMSADVPVLTSATGVFAGPRPKPNDPTKIAVQQDNSKKYQEMARIAATGGGQSGSHPAWDPV
jgi:hypothetical protein